MPYAFTNAPLPTYAVEEIATSGGNFALHTTRFLKRIFRYSVTALQNFLERPTWEQLVEKWRENCIKHVREFAEAKLREKLLWRVFNVLT